MSGFYLAPRGTSTPGDGGWSYLDTTFAEFGLQLGPGDSQANYAMCPVRDLPSVIYAAVPRTSTQGGGTHCYLSENSGATWAAKGSILADGYPLTEAPSFQVVATSSSTVYVLYAGNNSTYSGIWKSTDSGSTWTKIIAFPYSSGAQASIVGHVGWMDVATSKLFFAEMATASLTTFSNSYKFYRAALDGTSIELIGTRVLAPSSVVHGAPSPAHRFVMRAIDDTNVLAISVCGDYVRGDAYVSATTLTVTSTTYTTLGSPLLVTPIDGGSELGSVYWYVDYTSASSTGGTPNIQLGFSYQNDDTSWSAVIGTSNHTLLTGGESYITWCNSYAIPAGPRLIQLYARHTTAGRTATANGLTISDTRDTGVIYHITSSGTVTNLRPLDLRHPWDVLLLEDDTWLAAGDETDYGNVSVYRTDDAGSTWAEQQTVAAADAFIWGTSSANRGALQNAWPMLARTSIADQTQAAMLGRASTQAVPAIAQIVWVSEDSGSSWATLTTPATPRLPGGIYLAAGPLVAIPSQMVTILG